MSDRMRWKLAGTAMVLLGTLGAAGCNRGGGYTPEPVEEFALKEVTQEDAANLIPLAQGNEWVYEVTRAGAEPEELTIRVKSVNDTPNGKVAQLEFLRDNRVNQVQRWRVSDKGVFVLSLQGSDAAGTLTPPQDYNPPKPIVIFPYEAGKATPYEGTGPRQIGGVGPMRGGHSVVGSQGVDTAQGRMSALNIEDQTVWSIPGNAANNQPAMRAVQESVSWFSPGVGLVKVIEAFRLENANTNELMLNEQGAQIQITSTVSLKSHTLK